MSKHLTTAVVALIVGAIAVIIFYQPSDDSAIPKPVAQAPETKEQTTVSSQTQPTQQQTETTVATAKPEQNLKELNPINVAEIDPALMQQGSVDYGPIKAWEINDQQPIVEENGLHVAHAQINTGVIENFAVGQTLTLPLPHINDVVDMKLTSTRNALDDVNVWTGQKVNGESFETVSISRGAKQTYMTVATAAGVYTVTIDNQSGNTTIIDDSEITYLNSQKGTDSVTPTAIEEVPPENPS
ncbi:hypothetical protein [Zooshikella harenae]|uniref:Uncharacterized protein n=1 Tax=Zooshikella harenae TaxID=2827238 RepID=A0ABS5ZEY7_9GAMM|nr:hypothetical protein [Zooshikella harenae]MBU2712540.1 hypothetical protein [Zooshikella harenae]